MLRRLLGLDNVESVNYFELHFRSSWPAVVAAVLILCAAIYVVYLYRQERTLSRLARISLGTVRAVLLAALILLLFEPVLALELTTRLRRNILVLVDCSESMGFADQRKKQEDIEDAARAMGRMPFDKSKPQAVPAGQLRNEFASVRRLDLVKGILKNAELRLLPQLERNHKVDGFAFAENLSAVGDADTLAAARLDPNGKATTLGSAIEAAASRYGGSTIEGVILLTDGASNAGVEPLTAAGDLKNRGIPLYPVGIGLSNPPDLRIENVIVQETVFSRDKVPLRVAIYSTGYRGQVAEFKVTLDDPAGVGNELARKSVLLTGGVQYEEMSFVPLAGSTTSRLRVEVAPLPGEIDVGNNKAARPIQVIEDTIKVLYVEGMPRWEYRYLRVVLQRDPRLDVKFLMTEGDKELPKYSKQYLAAFPETAAEAFPYDLVILGEVPATYFNAAQLAQVEKLVKERSGSLLVLSGRRYTPATYRDTPIAGMLPVALGANDFLTVGDDVYPAVTPDGYRSSATSIEATRPANEELWRLVKPLYQLPYVTGAKPGAKVLLELPEFLQPGQGYPLVAWHRYGAGKCMFVGTDQLWRLRFKRGDQYHARFWGQTIQFLALSRLLGANKKIHLDIDRKTTQAGEQVRFFADVLNDAYEPLQAESYTVLVVRKDWPTSATSAGTEEPPLEVRLQAVPNNPGFFQGAFVPHKKGSFVLRPYGEDASLANPIEFDVEDQPLEHREPAMQEDLLRKMAETTGGKYFPIRDLPALAQTIAERQQTADVRLEKELWDVPAAFIVVVLLGGVEWYFRRRYNLV